MRTHTIHKQKPLFRRNETYLSRGDDLRDVIQALQAGVDAFTGTNSFLLTQFKQALKKAKNL